MESISISITKISKIKIKFVTEYKSLQIHNEISSSLEKSTFTPI
jgi:hypothetical protein